MFELSCNRKVKFYPTQFNTFGFLPGPPAQGGTCPGCTEGFGGCWSVKAGDKGINKVCYVSKLMKAYRNIHNLLTKNTQQLKAMSTEEKFKAFIEIFKNFESKCDAYAKAKKIKSGDIKYFRLYWSGDIDNMSTAAALNTAMSNHQNITFWTYTRSLDWVHMLTTNNLVLYLSLDTVNEKEVLEFYNKNKDSQRLRLAYLSKQQPKIKGIKFKPCPVDLGKLDLEFACKKCKLCYTGDNHIWFKEK